jgi:hypothetical protein
MQRGEPPMMVFEAVIDKFRDDLIDIDDPVIRDQALQLLQALHGEEWRLSLHEMGLVFPPVGEQLLDAVASELA